MSILIQQQIEQKKKLFPIWLNVTRSEVAAKSLALASIVSIVTAGSPATVTSSLVEVISEGAKSRGVIPVWESPGHRFLQGLGEVNLVTGQTTTIFELVLAFKEDDYPFWLGGRSYTKKQLLLRIAESISHDPDRVINWVEESGLEDLRQMCIDEGLHLD
jgi:hypothetical protein